MNLPSQIPLENKNNEQYVRQHLIDPDFCLACGSCKAACPEGAIQTNDMLYRYVIDPLKCNNSHECLEVCSSDAIKTWHMVPADQMYSMEEQFSWDLLPAELEVNGEVLPASLDQDELPQGHPAPASASQPETFRYTQAAPVLARVISNTRVTAEATDTDVHHILLDFAGTDFNWLEGQNIGVIPPGMDANGQPHRMRAYSIASSRSGETAGSREMALTIKRVVDVWDGQPYYGVASNYMCDLKPGDSVRCVGPIGEHFLMPLAPESRIMMICSGTGIAPMRSIIQQQQRLDHAPASPMQLFYGGRTPQELAYSAELNGLPETMLNIHLALSRVADQPKQYVQDLLKLQADQVVDLLRDKNTHIFICGMIAMGQEVMKVLAEIAGKSGLSWDELHHELLHSGRLQIETY